MGLLHGSQPEWFVLCHDPSRAHVDGYPDQPLPSLTDAIDLHALRTRASPGIRWPGSV